MKKFLQKKLKNEKGLTLVELLAVIVILGIIAAIAVPAIGNIIDNSRIKATHADALNIISAANLYLAEHPDPTGDKVTLKMIFEEKLIDDAGKFQDKKDSEDVYVSKKDGGNTFTGSANWKAEKTVEYSDATIKEINDAGTKAKNDGNVKITR
ncbi:type II secretion system protein [Sporosarcina sp.]|uniref:type II secretion system protein n=1 Tax=Sporosarcina sp. TaxID=49982 RepID=UPI002612BC89|nr:prepilin-type N-terminal cleavage/methylation domain-containing protein [Sporosarcina sp.]